MKTRIALFILITTFLMAFTNSFPIQKYHIGDTAPSFVTSDVKGNEFNLYKELENSKVVLIFYRGVWCPYCNQHVQELTKNIDEIQDAGGKVVLVTPDQPSFVKDMQKNSSEKITFISDNDNKIMDLYDVTFELNEMTSAKWNKQRENVKKTTGKEDYLLPIPATFVIGKDRVINWVHFVSDYKERSDINDIIKNLK